MMDEVFEQTHWPLIEILQMVKDRWPGQDRFTMTQAKLLISIIDKTKKEMKL